MAQAWGCSTEGVPPAWARIRKVLLRTPPVVAAPVLASMLRIAATVEKVVSHTETQTLFSGLDEFLNKPQNGWKGSDKGLNYSWASLFPENKKE